MTNHKKSGGQVQQIRSLILKWLITSLAIFAAIYLVPGIHFSGPGWQLGVIAAIFSVVNLLLRPVLLLITCPMIVLTLGLFSVAINALMLIITANVAVYLGIAYSIDSFTTAFIGALVISFTSLVLNMLAGEGSVQVNVHRE
ncbi:MAG: phage holin family protein [Chloroflexales bacterium]|nr:phage holin family protein [Chloroflexales bacterium]